MAKNTDGQFEELSNKLCVMLSLQLRILLGDDDFSSRRRKGTGDIVNYFSGFGLNAKDIASITGAPLQSVRTLLTPQRRK